ncbi:hypothetical protein CDD83_4086 [Cordyceps sp. RAO-2017]|nr:hypothetical protein CDD83_4086 [Cordyceps sp. RAO-2017]
MAALVVAISGCSSSGKTTLARLLRDIFPASFILHEDDFYRPETELPSKDGLLDWDCAEAIDVEAMIAALAYVRQHAALPPTLESKEDRNAIGKCPVPDGAVATLKSRVAASLPPADESVAVPRLCFLDGFLLYSPTTMAALQPSLDLRLFVRASRARAKQRREARCGYVTLEGFWEDPPGYVDAIVWPNYVAEHAWMFEGGDVEGAFRYDVLDQTGIRVLKDAPLDADMHLTLEWAVETILEEMRKHAPSGS